MTDWPACLTEDETLARMEAGVSISRFGDGEMVIALGGGTSTHKPNAKLSQEFRGILKSGSSAGLVVAIPTMDERYPNWLRHLDRYSRVVNPDLDYGSAFVGRPQCAHWIDRPDYVARFRKIWAGRHVAAVSSDDHPLPRWLMDRDNASVTHISCPKTEAYSEISSIESACRRADPDIVVACAGPAATALAARLSRKGIQTIDLGRGSGFLWKRKDDF